MTWAGPKYFDDLGCQDPRKILSVGRNSHGAGAAGAARIAHVAARAVASRCQHRLHRLPCSNRCRLRRLLHPWQQLLLAPPASPIPPAPGSTAPPAPRPPAQLRRRLPWPPAPPAPPAAVQLAPPAPGGGAPFASRPPLCRRRRPRCPNCISPNGVGRAAPPAQGPSRASALPTRQSRLNPAKNF